MLFLRPTSTLLRQRFWLSCRHQAVITFWTGPVSFVITLFTGSCSRMKRATRFVWTTALLTTTRLTSVTRRRRQLVYVVLVVTSTGTALHIAMLNSFCLLTIICFHQRWSTIFG